MLVGSIIKSQTCVICQFIQCNAGMNLWMKVKKPLQTLVFFDGKSSLTKAPFIMVLPVVKSPAQVFLEVIYWNVMFFKSKNLLENLFKSLSVHAEKPFVNLCVIFFYDYHSVIWQHFDLQSFFTNDGGLFSMLYEKRNLNFIWNFDIRRLNQHSVFDLTNKCM